MRKKQELWGDSDTPNIGFDAVIMRPRHDGWTMEKQMDFIQSLAEGACVADACDRVGMTTQSAYRLRARADAESFRLAWDAALDQALQRLADVAMNRAIHGVSRPVFFQGEQIGERRHYDERLTMFLLRYRDGNRYGKWKDKSISEHNHPDSVARSLAQCLLRVMKDGLAFDGGDPAPVHPPFDPAGRVGVLDGILSRLLAVIKPKEQSPTPPPARKVTGT